MSDYEAEREARIAANNQLLKTLGIHATRDSLGVALFSTKRVSFSTICAGRFECSDELHPAEALWPLSFPQTQSRVSAN